MQRVLSARDQRAIMRKPWEGASRLKRRSKMKVNMVPSLHEPD
jgi:hypothetical protein